MLYPHEYTALRNELNAIWGLQQITDLVPAQAEVLLNKAAASVRTAADIAASSELPQPHLPTPGPVPRPVLQPSGQEASTSNPAGDSRQQSVQDMPGDLYASSERGMVRTAGQARINSRQQKALQSGLLRLSSPQRLGKQGNAMALLDRPDTVQSTSSAPALPDSLLQRSSQDASSRSASTPPSIRESTLASKQLVSDRKDGPASAKSASISSLRRSSKTLPRLSSRQRTAEPGSESASSSSSGDTAAQAAAEGRARTDATAGKGVQRVIRGRAPRQALAAAKGERQMAGSNAGPSGRSTPDYSFLSSDQQRVSQLVLLSTHVCFLSVTDKHTNMQNCFSTKAYMPINPNSTLA